MTATEPFTTSRGTVYHERFDTAEEAASAAPIAKFADHWFGVSSLPGGGYTWLDDDLNPPGDIVARYDGTWHWKRTGKAQIENQIRTAALQDLENMREQVDKTLFKPAGDPALLKKTLSQVGIELHDDLAQLFALAQSGKTQREIAKILGRAQSWVSVNLRKTHVVQPGTTIASDSDHDEADELPGTSERTAREGAGDSKGGSR